jgi:hypothetical protein
MDENSISVMMVGVSQTAAIFSLATLGRKNARLRPDD